ncbi:hypothetical protein PHBOTO_004297, partial [Pseudozyma hubeiensis]
FTCTDHSYTRLDLQDDIATAKMLFCPHVAFMLVAAAVRVISAGLPQPFSMETEPQQEPDTDLSLGRIYQDHSRKLLAESSRPSGSRRLVTELHLRPSAFSVNDESLNLHLGTTERQTELEREARVKQVENLREDLRRYYDSSWESWPNGHITQGRYHIYVPTITTRAMGAFLLRDKYKDIIDAKGGGTIWPLERYQRWHDSLPDRAPVGRNALDRIDDESNEVKNQVENIERTLRSYEQAFRT